MFWKFKHDIISELVSMKKALELQSDRTNDLEQYSRRNCILIHGVKEERSEDCIALALNLFHRMKLNIDFPHIDRAHRLKGKKSPGRSRAIIVKFCSYHHKRMVYSNKKLLKGSGMYVSESLTRSNFQILCEANKAFSQGNVWTLDGRIYVKVGDEKHVITNMRQLNSLTKTPHQTIPQPPPPARAPPTAPLDFTQSSLYLSTPSANVTSNISAISCVNQLMSDSSTSGDIQPTVKPVALKLSQSAPQCSTPVSSGGCSKNGSTSTSSKKRRKKRHGRRF
ncbi:hypothetical protein WDU94_010888 [Cyamophila willieti]